MKNSRTAPHVDPPEPPHTRPPEGASPSPGARPSAHDRTAWDLAVRNNRPDAVAELLDAGADPDAAMGEHRETTALRYAAPRGMTAMAQRLLAAGAQPDGRLDEGQATPLMLASAQGDLDMMRLLLDRGASPRSVASRRAGIIAPGPPAGMPDGSPLASAAHGGHLEAVRLLLEHGARPDPETREAAVRGGRKPRPRDSGIRRGTPEEYRAIQELLEREGPA
ncbi:ankyrin repeat domain-containing protein [Streptomyces californicus]|uniref:Ankyrin repeat domain-containing protein n=1 Tax=Streptomyces californicus TaxID=67351 RepID=A0ABD7D011_9ACTN|nr:MULTISPECIES: ankyrin repeat domain-containing protein [Streptomyces]QRV27483.1 ankyrin repeat domain-containing protein [Streptomyces californicus]QRV36860.1 ankyrin repeat domain-containing protein [Streptomyces californicus]QRV40882.1 ankyrin repeat domain-containing protein [Streptomyces californicus]QRV47630.1 ankyrin repeat domain-containing protein [Streptomyces californicus]